MYFLTILASLSQSTMVPRALRTNLAVRLIMPCRLPWAATLTLPVPVILKRFLAPLLVFSLGILLAPFRSRAVPRLAALALRGGGTHAGAQSRAHDHPGRPFLLQTRLSRHGMPRRAT